MAKMAISKIADRDSNSLPPAFSMGCDLTGRIPSSDLGYRGSNPRIPTIL